MTEEIHVGDVGTAFEITLMDGTAVLAGLEDATEMLMVFQRADKTKFEVPATFKTDGTDGIVVYHTVEGDLSMKGKWKVQAVITLPTGKWSSSVGGFTVYPNL